MKIRKILAIIILSCMVLSLSSTNQLTSLAKSNSNTITKEHDINFESITIQSPANINIIAIFHPFKGAHNTISTDKITLRADSSDVKIINYITVGS